MLSVEPEWVVTNPALQCRDVDRAEYQASMYSDEPRTKVRGSHVVMTATSSNFWGDWEELRNYPFDL